MSGNQKVFLVALILQEFHFISRLKRVLLKKSWPTLVSKLEEEVTKKSVRGDMPLPCKTKI